MKIAPEHYESLKAAIETIPAEKIAEYVERVKPNPKRLRWDLLHAVMPASWVCDHIYPYANDEHLDTALRRIVVELGIAS